MTVNKLIALVDELKPNHYSKQRKIEWINQIEGQIYNNIILTHENTEQITFKGYSLENDGDVEFIASGIYEDLYRYYLESQIDFANQEINKFNNSAAMHNSLYSDFEKAYRRSHLPVHQVSRPNFYKGG